MEWGMIWIEWTDLYSLPLVFFIITSTTTSWFREVKPIQFTVTTVVCQVLDDFFLYTAVVWLDNFDWVHVAVHTTSIKILISTFSLVRFDVLDILGRCVSFWQTLLNWSIGCIFKYEF